MTTSPPTPSTDYTVADQQRMSKATRYFEWQSRLSEAQLGRRVLEVGCGLGNFTQHLLDREMVVCIDIETACVERLRARFGQRPNLVVMPMDALDPAFLALDKHAVDSIACLNVLEHIEDDQLLLARMHEILPRGGRVVLIVPAFDALYGPIDVNLGHFRRYSKQSLTKTATLAGLRPKILRYMNSVGCIGWWVNARVLRKTEQSEGQIALFDSVVVPVLSRLEALVEPPFGQSIFAVLEKA